MTTTTPTKTRPAKQGKNERGDVYQIVTDRIIALLEAGVVPWHKPWRGGHAPANLVSGKEYRGVNVWMLGASGFSSPYWLSYKQAQEMGGNVRKGEKSSIAVFWKMLQVEDKAEAKGKLVPELTHLAQRACYCRASDTVNMPDRRTFDSEPEYYSTLFHELTHATGHESRLGRLQNSVSGFGSTSYAKEELVAEMGASFLSARAGIELRTIDNFAAYIASWLGRLKDDRKLVVHAAAAAQKAVDFIGGKLAQEGAQS